MSTKRTPKDLAKFLLYVLGRRPDEFGLVADTDGYVKIKELLKAVNEEAGWQYVRKGHLNEAVISVSDSPIEMNEESIRAISREGLIKQSPAENLPKHLFTCVSQKSYAHVLEKGVLPGSFPMVILSSDQQMAERIGKRRDQDPVLLTINTQKAANQGVFFYQAGEMLITAKTIPPGCFTGPLVSMPTSETIQPRKKEVQKSRKPAGSFVLDLEETQEKQKRRVGKKRRNEVEWKEDRKKMRKGKYLHPSQHDLSKKN